MVSALLGGMLLLHTGAGRGDFGMLAFLLRYPVRDFRTLARSNEGKTWFSLLPADGRAPQRA